ncbi:MAG: hypothetical protein KGJ89_03510 [Patescibacteria group bacterium]|nr:hypothetical protein [Patescibacteria group bacterium]MDE2015386.1 hypothetical protein [Patescibacteria group bacterium]MDE2226999.1 hypothetical protein [Patescibacteria group bacterium]
MSNKTEQFPSTPEVYPEMRNLNLKKYLEDAAYRKIVDTTSNYIDRLYYWEKIDELVGFFKNERLGLPPEQIEKIKELFLRELADLRPQLYEKSLLKKLGDNISRDFSFAEKLIEDNTNNDGAPELDLEPEFKHKSKVQEKENEDDENFIDLWRFTNEPKYRIESKDNTYVQEISGRERNYIIGQLLSFGSSLGLTPKQTEILISLADEENQSNFLELAKEHRLFSKERLKEEKRENVIGRKLEELKGQYNSRTYRKFKDTANKMLAEEFGTAGESPAEIKKKFGELEIRLSKGKITQNQFTAEVEKLVDDSLKAKKQKIQ